MEFKEITEDNITDEDAKMIIIIADECSAKFNRKITEMDIFLMGVKKMTRPDGTSFYEVGHKIKGLADEQKR